MSFFQFMANLEQSGSQIPREYSVKATFSLIELKQSRTKKSLTQLSHYCFESRYCFCQKIQFFFKKNVDIFNMLTRCKIKRALVLKGIFSETTYVCVLTYQISSFQHNSKRFQTRGVILPPSTSRQTPKEPTQLRVNVRSRVLFTSIWR